MKHRNPRRMAQWFFLPLILAACASPPPSGQGRSDDGDWSVVQPYHHPRMGMGGAPVLGSVLVPENGELQQASRALIMALQVFLASVVKPVIGVDGVIPTRTTWTTDASPLSADVIAVYNAAFPALRLPPAQYLLVYEGQHDVSAGAFRYKISARLFAKGAIGAASPVQDNRYAGRFFVERLAAAVAQQLKATG